MLKVMHIFSAQRLPLFIIMISAGLRRGVDWLTAAVFLPDPVTVPSMLPVTVSP